MLWIYAWVYLVPPQPKKFGGCLTLSMQIIPEVKWEHNTLWNLGIIWYIKDHVLFMFQGHFIMLNFLSIYTEADILSLIFHGDEQPLYSLKKTEVSSHIFKMELPSLDAREIF